MVSKTHDGFMLAHGLTRNECNGSTTANTANLFVLNCGRNTCLLETVPETSVVLSNHNCMCE